MQKDSPTVTWGPWSVSVTTGDGIQGALLSVNRHYDPSRSKASTYKIARGELDGQVFASEEEAWEAAKARGYTEVWRRSRRRGRSWASDTSTANLEHYTHEW